MTKIIFESKPDDIEDWRFADEAQEEYCRECGKELNELELDCDREVCFECYCERR